MTTRVSATITLRDLDGVTVYKNYPDLVSIGADAFQIFTSVPILEDILILARKAVTSGNPQRAEVQEATEERQEDSREGQDTKASVDPFGMEVGSSDPLWRSGSSSGPDDPSEL